jgi:hypothetical protein
MQLRRVYDIAEQAAAHVNIGVGQNAPVGKQSEVPNRNLSRHSKQYRNRHAKQGAQQSLLSDHAMAKPVPSNTG